MLCAQCGAYADQNTKYCPVCGAPLPKEQAPPITIEPIVEEVFAPMTTPAPAGNAAASEDEPAWGFVRAPKWPTPSFDFNTLDETTVQSKPAPPVAYAPPTAPPPAFGGGRFEPRPFSPQNEPQPSVQPQPIPHRTNTGNYPSSTANAYEQSGFGRAPQRVPQGFQPDDDTSYDIFDEEEDDIAPATVKRSISTPKRAAASSSIRSARSSRSSLHKKRINSSTLIFAGAVALLLILLLVFGGIYINKNFGSMSGLFTTIFGGSPLLAEPIVSEGKDTNGVDCYLVKIETREGNVITMRVGGVQLSQEVDSKKFKTLHFPKYLFLPTEPVDAETAEMVPDIIITTPKGEDYQVELKPITVNIPSLTLTLTSPDAEQVTVGRNIVNIIGVVDQPETEVLVEGLALEVDESGNFSGAFELPGVGSHTITLEARKGGFQIARKTITVDYTQSEANIELDRSTIRANETGLATIKGKLDAGARMTVSGPDGVTLGTPTVDASGNFSFTAQMANTGFYEITCAVTKEGSTSTDTIITEFAPNYQTYTAAVHRLAYSRMLNETLHVGAYKCVGTVTEIFNSGNYDLAKLVTADGEEMVFEYRNNVATVELNDGKEYSLYADYIGMDTEHNLPKVYTWYITKK